MSPSTVRPLYPRLVLMLLMSIAVLTSAAFAQRQATTSNVSRDDERRNGGGAESAAGSDLQRLVVAATDHTDVFVAQGVVEFIVPLSVHAVTSFRGRVDILGVVEVHFDDQLFFAAGASADVGGYLSELLHEGDGAEAERS